MMKRKAKESSKDVFSEASAEDIAAAQNFISDLSPEKLAELTRISLALQEQGYFDYEKDCN